MKLQDVLLKAMAKKITWWEAAEIVGVTDRTMRRWREKMEEHGYSGLADSCCVVESYSWADQAAPGESGRVQPTSSRHGEILRKQLPARPNLEHLRTQAKALLTRFREGDAQAARTFAKYLPEATTLSSGHMREHGFPLADAQAAIARKTGFAAWPAWRRHVERLLGMEGTWSFRSARN